MFGRVLSDAGSLNQFRTTYEPLANTRVGDEYLGRGTVRGFFKKTGEMVGGYVINMVPEFRYLNYLPEEGRRDLPFQVGRDRIAEVTCIWITPHGRPLLLRYKVYTQLVVDAFRTKATYILGSSTIESIRRVQQRLMKHLLWHGIDINSEERWLYCVKRQELFTAFGRGLIIDLLERRDTHHEIARAGVPAVAGPPKIGITSD
jgi:hypothetical protein